MTTYLALALVAYGAARLAYRRSHRGGGRPVAFRHHPAGHALRHPWERGAIAPELVVVGLAVLAGTLALVLTDHAPAASFERLAWALVSLASGGTLGAMTGRRDARRRDLP